MLFLYHGHLAKLVLRVIVVAVLSFTGFAGIDAMQTANRLTDSQLNQEGTETAEAEDPVTDLWANDLPAGAIARYGATDRNPEAVGVMGLSYSNGGELLAIQDQRQQIRILNLKTRELVAVLPTETHRDFVFSADDKSIVVGERKSIHVWDIESEKHVRKIDQSGYHIAFNRDGDEFTAVSPGEVNQYRWPLPSKPKQFLTTLTSGTIYPVGLSPDGRFALFHNGRQGELLDTKTGRPVRGSAGMICRNSAFSKDSTQLVVFNQGLQTMTYYDLRNAKHYNTKIADRRRFNTATFSSDGRFLYTGNYNNEIVIWDLLTKTVMDRMIGHSSRVNSIAADRGLLQFASGASAIGDRSVIFWDLKQRFFPDAEMIGELDWDALWNDLGSDELKRSLDATQRLYQTMRQDPNIFATLESKLDLVEASGDIDALLRQLDDEKFSTREEATRKLRLMVSEIRPQLEKFIENSSQESKWRILKMLRGGVGKPSSSSVEGRRDARIVLALELCGDERSMETLRRIANFSSSSNAISEANAAILRLDDGVQ